MSTSTPAPDASAIDRATARICPSARQSLRAQQAREGPQSRPLETKRGRDAQSMIEAEGNTRLLVAHVRRIRFPLDARARAAPGGTTRHSVRPDWAPVAKPALTLIGCIPDR